MSTTTETILCPMPLRVESMPLSWLCETRGKDEVTGFRVWGDRARERIFRVVKREGGYEAQSALEPGIEWYTCAYFQKRTRAIEWCEHAEGERFNAAQTDPRAAVRQ